MSLRFYNTLTQQVEPFAPAADNTVRMYTCGPTVYDFAHIGNFRTFTFVDLLRKVIRLDGLGLNHVMNITDVDDKIIREAVARVDVDSYEKADARDFALWKAPKDGEPFWTTAIGPGRPGWHIECSVMAIKYLGETLDIHAGGVDLIFPHHENEIAQSESLTSKPFARFWLHAESLMVEGQKMSKSLGNFYTLRDLIAKGYSPEAIRYLLASVPYRKSLNFTIDGLKAAVIAIDRLRNFKLRLETDRFTEGANEAI